jgi:hypothetical protein
LQLAHYLLPNREPSEINTLSDVTKMSVAEEVTSEGNNTIQFA